MKAVRYEIECGKEQTAIDISGILPTMMCTEHKRYERVMAIETREWRLYCVSQGAHRRCGYTRWFGDSHSEAIRAGNNHSDISGHPNQEIDYMRVPKKQSYVKKLFSRAVKDVIIPKERQTKSEDMRRNKDYIVQSLPIPNDTDEPEF